MYVCNCNAIRESELRGAAPYTCGGAEEAYALLGKLPNCGQCLDDADAILAHERAFGSSQIAA